MTGFASVLSPFVDHKTQLGKQDWHDHGVNFCVKLFKRFLLRLIKGQRRNRSVKEKVGRAILKVVFVILTYKGYADFDPPLHWASRLCIGCIALQVSHLSCFTPLGFVLGSLSFFILGLVCYALAKIFTQKNKERSDLEMWVRIIREQSNRECKCDAWGSKVTE